MATAVRVWMRRARLLAALLAVVATLAGGSLTGAPQPAAAAAARTVDLSPESVTRPTASLRIDGHAVDVFAPAGRIKALFVLLPGYELSSADLEAHSNLVGPARSAGWLLAYVNTLAGSWDAGLCCKPASSSHEADAGVIANLAASLRGSYHLSAQVPLILGGFSNGAMMAEEVICRRPGLAAGALLMAGGLQDPGCGSARVKQLLMIRGLNDTTVPIAGTRWSHYLKTRLLSDRSTLAAAEQGSHCAAPAVTAAAKVTKTIINCGKNRITYITEPGSHGWLRGSRAAGTATLPEITALVARLTH